MTPPNNRWSVLVTNDDGIGSDGLRQLALVAHESGLEVIVAAPRDNASGASASLTAVRADGEVVVEPCTLRGLDGVPSFGVGATPAFIVLMASRGAFGPVPDVVLSGVNRGHNAGQAVLHSGTVGAALTGAAAGCRAMAVSVVTRDEPNWESGAEAARRVLPTLLASPPRTVVNVNSPNTPAAQLRGIRRARLASFGAVRMNVIEAGHGFVRVQLADAQAEFEAGTDAALLAEGWATVTPLEPICESTTDLFEKFTGDRDTT